MAKEHKPAEATDGLLTTAAKKIGKAAGKVAAALGATPEPSATGASPLKQAASPGKLQKKNKDRLPRREKKARQKSEAKQAQ